MVKETDPKMHQEIARALEEKGEDWLVAALVDGSIGYHTPSSARRLLQDYKAGRRKDWCERCMCLYRCDLEAMMLSDVRYFRRREEHNPEAVARLIAWCRAVEQLDGISQMTAGLMFPSSGL